jgi:hypothetical protein
MAAWGEGNAGIREVLVSRQWTRNDKLNVPKVVSPDKTMAITLIAGDKNTGNPDEVPQTKRPRRAGSQQLVVNNVQPVFPELDLEDDGDADAQAKLWYVLFHRTGEVLKCELSLPTAVDDNGLIEDYLERIILPDLDAQNPPPESGDDVDPDVDVPVQRRAG